MAARLTLITSILLFLAGPVMAAPTLPEQLYYRISWGGIPLGRIRVSASEDDIHYRMVVDTKSKGVVSVFTPFQTVAQVQGSKREGRYIPQEYTTNASKSDEGDNRTSRIRYDDEGQIIERTTTPQDDPRWRPPVPLEEANDAADPITCFIAMRALLLQNREQGVKETSLRSYDAKRLALLKATLIKNPDPKKGAIATRITRIPISGYTPKEWKKYKKGDPALTAWFSDDIHVMPTRLELDMILGTIVAKQETE